MKGTNFVRRQHVGGEMHNIPIQTFKMRRKKDKMLHQNTGLCVYVNIVEEKEEVCPGSRPLGWGEQSSRGREHPSCSLLPGSSALQ